MLENSDIIAISKRWYEFCGKEEKKQESNEEISSLCIFRFTTYWFAFNYLYNELNFYNKEYMYEKNNSSKQNIKKKISEKYSCEIMNYNMGEDKKYINLSLERPKIVLFIDSVIDKLVKSDFLKILESQEEINKEYIKPLQNGKVKDKNRAEYYYNNMIKNTNSPELRIMCTIMSLYQMRCNLFHGSKSPEEERDLRLVTEGANLLEIILKIVLFG